MVTKGTETAVENEEIESAGHSQKEVPNGLGAALDITGVLEPSPGRDCFS